MRRGLRWSFLSAKTDLTSLVLLGLYDGKWHEYTYAWTPAPTLYDRAKQDRAPYDVWAKDGYLRTTPSASIDYDYIAMEVADIVSDIKLVSIGYDRWRMDVFQKELDRIGLDLPLEPWGQGFKDMAPALDGLETRILNQTLVHGNNPVLNMCANNAMVTKNPAGDRKLDKMKTSGRIDCMVALAMACGVADRIHESNDISSFISNPLVL